ncbi:MAG TPA: hypothetical protein VF607_15285, partial [Verrucomicrobiae bacterium]
NIDSANLGGMAGNNSVPCRFSRILCRTGIRSRIIDFEWCLDGIDGDRCFWSLDCLAGGHEQ